MKQGIFADVIQWITHPAYSSEPPGGWLIGTLLFITLLFGWRQVIRMLGE